MKALLEHGDKAELATYQPFGGFEVRTLPWMCNSDLPIVRVTTCSPGWVQLMTAVSRVACKAENTVCLAVKTYPAHCCAPRDATLPAALPAVHDGAGDAVHAGPLGRRVPGLVFHVAAVRDVAVSSRCSAPRIQKLSSAPYLYIDGKASHCSFLPSV